MNGNTRLWCHSSLGTLVLAAAVAAAEPLGPIHISGKANSDSNIFVITPEELTQYPDRGIEDWLNHLGIGIQTVRQSGAGGIVSAFVDGGASDQLLLVVDGVIYNPTTLGQPPLAALDRSQIKRLEILRGSAASRYGSGAQTVLRISSHSDNEQSAWLAIGSHQQRQGGLRLSKHHGRLFTSLSWSGQQEDGYADRAPQSAQNHSSKQEQVQTQLRWQAGANHQLLGQYQQQGNGSEYLAFSGETAQHASQQSARLQWQSLLGHGWYQELAVSQLLQRLDQSGSSDFSGGQRQSLHGQWRLPGSARQQIEIGFDAFREQAQSLYSGSDSGRLEHARRSAWLQQEWRLAGDNRLHWSLQGERRGGRNHGSAAWSYRQRLNAQQQIQLAWRDSFRAASLTERYASYGNPDLQPERVQLTEFFLKHQLRSQTAFWRLRLFARSGKQIIAWDSQRQQMHNIAYSHSEGLQLGRHPQPNKDGWRFGGHVLLQRVRDEHGQLLPRISEQQGALESGYKQGPWRFHFQWLYRSQRADVGEQQLASYNRLNAALYWTRGRWRLYNRWDNLIQEHYAEAVGYPAAGRRWLFGIQYTLQ